MQMVFVRTFIQVSCWSPETMRGLLLGSRSLLVQLLGFFAVIRVFVWCFVLPENRRSGSKSPAHAESFVNNDGNLLLNLFASQRNARLIQQLAHPFTVHHFCLYNKTAEGGVSMRRIMFFTERGSPQEVLSLTRLASQQVYRLAVWGGERERDLIYWQVPPSPSWVWVDINTPTLSLISYLVSDFAQLVFGQCNCDSQGCCLFGLLTYLQAEEWFKRGTVASTWRWAWRI